MIADIKAIFDFFLDKSKSIGFKTGLFISIIGFAFIIDYCFNFSYNIYITNKLNNLEAVNRLENVYQNDSIQLEKLKTIETKLLNSQHYLEFLSFHLSKIDLKSKKIDQKNNQTTNVKISQTNIIRSKFWMVLTSNFILVLFYPFIFFLPIYNKDQQDKYTIIGWFSSLVVITGIILLITWIAYQIPIVFGNPIWNYILNFIIHISFVIILGILINNASNSNKTKN